MRLRYCFLSYFNILILFFALSFPGLAFNPLSEEQADEVYNHLTAQWKPVDYKQPLGFETIFQELDPSLWPALPESYEWRISKDNAVQLFKHESAQDHDFDFVTYTTDSLAKFNFLSRWDGVTHHSFAYARQNSPLSSYDSARSVFPISEFHYNKQTYMRGHCIDYLDTYGLSETSKLKEGTVIESISTLDPRNYIPEPRNPNPYWGETLRKNLVGQIRSEGGCYTQYMYYGLTPLRTDDETATAIPKGVYFVNTKPDQPPLTTSYHVSWAHDFTAESTNTNWVASLQKLQARGNFFPSPFVHNLNQKRSEIAFQGLSLTYQLPPGELSWQDYWKIAKIADHEVQNVMGKITLVHYLLNQSYDSVQIQTWLKRLVEHAIEIHANGSYGFMDTLAVPQLIEKLRKIPEVDKDHTFADWLTQLCHNDQEQVKKKDLTTFYHLKPLKISGLSHVIPITEIDVGVGTKTCKKAVGEVVAHLRKNPRVRLLNLTTQRAGQIAEGLTSIFPTPQERKALFIEYTSPDSGQIKGMRVAFTNVGITPTKIESPKSSPLKSPLQTKNSSETSKVNSLSPIILVGKKASSVQESLKEKAKNENPQQPLSIVSKGNFKSLLTTVAPLLTDLDRKTVQKLCRTKRDQTMAEYFTCPTIEDGNCFFHAVFTEPEDSIHVVQEKAENMRKQLCEVSQQSQYINHLRPLLYEHYIELLTHDDKHSKVPENIKFVINNKNKYTLMYNSMKEFNISINHEITPQPENKYPIETIQAMIQQDHITTYMERFRHVGGEDTYIPFRPTIQCPVDLLAGIGQRQINIFTFNATTQKLQFHKSAGTEGPIINILHLDNHFVRLYCLGEDNTSLNQCEQIWGNYFSSLH